jgi:hypothetical protein
LTFCEEELSLIKINESAYEEEQKILEQAAVENRQGLLRMHRLR